MFKYQLSLVNSRPASSICLIAAILLRALTEPFPVVGLNTGKVINVESYYASNSSSIFLPGSFQDLQNIQSLSFLHILGYTYILCFVLG